MAEFCGIEWKLHSLTNAFTLLLHMTLHTRISLLHAARLSVSCTQLTELDTRARGCHKGTGGIHPMKRNLIQSCSH